ncbi:tetratricopeptide repeat protein [Striga asiatica]|uniref:Tetratricopeptide repeat protein n=1 Tax=Striga asiatica TaxID=4170 RepID=A0A5A7QUA4_STRAF|nr:tetratricopeptide repeat protein [Striga asiatica]
MLKRRGGRRIAKKEKERRKKEIEKNFSVLPREEGNVIRKGRTEAKILSFPSPINYLGTSKIFPFTSPATSCCLCLSWTSASIFDFVAAKIMSSGSSESVADLFAEASKVVDALYITRDTYFPANPADKTSKLLVESNIALKLLDDVPPEKRKTPAKRAIYEYLRGKVLDVLPEYKKEAEDHLSKAVKLNPSLADAWLSLGNCIWKKGAQNQVEIVNDSIKHAKEAIALDVKDGNSWYNLGNACLTSFFVTGAWDHGKLQQSLKAYQHAEKDERMKSNPDLYYNCAIVNKYLENYERALSGFEAAALRDPGLNAVEEVQKIVQLLDKIESLLRGQAKFKRLTSLASSLSSVNVNPSYKRETVDNLLDGLNKAVAIVGRVMFFFKHETVAPLTSGAIVSIKTHVRGDICNLKSSWNSLGLLQGYYLLCDSSQMCFVLSVYGIHNQAIKEGDQVTLLEPSYHYVDFFWKEKSYQFRSVRVDFLEQVLVNGKALSPRHSVQTSIYAQNKT